MPLNFDFEGIFELRSCYTTVKIYKIVIKNV